MFDLAFKALMFWIVDNFLMRRKFPKGAAFKGDSSSTVTFLAKPRDMDVSDDEVVLHSLMDNESHDTIVTDDIDVFHRR